MAWDPYYGLNTALVIIGIIQLIIYRPRLKYLDSLSRSLWRVRENETSTAVYEKLLNDEQKPIFIFALTFELARILVERIQFKKTEILSS